jgi:hypothetical protein
MEIAWAAFLDELGEPYIPDWHDVGFIASTSHRKSQQSPEGSLDEHWHVLFFSLPITLPNDVAGRVWVDKQTGHCNVWINEDYEPNGIISASRKQAEDCMKSDIHTTPK